ncbi:DUF362 domain-containing protein [candidate division WOR-3 bacterium]|nr:DUF362 domain-containing protein [candidate division WOR-3 bacterium]
MKGISRREFLKLAGVGALGLAARRTLGGLLGPEAGPPRDLASTVVQCYDDTATSGASVREPVVQVMMDESIKALTGLSDVGEAWKNVFPGIVSTSIIGIKVNCINSALATHPAFVNCIASGLARMNFGGNLFRRNNIIIWDRTNSELTAAGYTIYTGTDPATVRCYGTNQSGVGYDTTVALNVAGVTSRPSRILSQQIDFMVNAAVLRTHGTAVVTLGMKNNYGSVDNPGSLHGGQCNPYLPSLNQQIRDVITPNGKQRLFVIDGMFGLYSGGPGGSPNCVPRTLIMSRDVVATDFTGQTVINAERARRGLARVNAPHILTAAQPPYSLGTTDVSLVEIDNPTAGKARPQRRALL